MPAIAASRGLAAAANVSAIRSRYPRKNHSPERGPTSPATFHPTVAAIAVRISRNSARTMTAP